MLTPDDKLYMTLNKVELEMVRTLTSKSIATQKYTIAIKAIFILLHIYSNSRLVMPGHRSMPD